MSIFDVQHQPTAHAVVQQSLLSGRLAHGLLLVGPAGVGKEMFATQLAGLLLCPQPVTSADGPLRAGVDPSALPAGLAPAAGAGAAWLDACGQCDSCHLVAAGTHPDLHVVYRELYKFNPKLKDRKGLELYIEVIREFMLDPSASKSSRGHGKVFIVRDAHLMNDEAQNSLLKTLEEPPPDSYIILVTDQATELLETIRSRCQLVRFAPLPVEFVRSRLAGRQVNARTIPADEAAYLAVRSGGQLGVALRMAEGDLFGLHQELADRLAGLTPSAAVDLADWLDAQTTTLARERIEREGVTDSQAKKEVACELLSTAALILADAIRLLSARRPLAPGEYTGGNRLGKSTGGSGPGEHALIFPGAPPPILFESAAAQIAGYPCSPSPRVEGRGEGPLAALSDEDRLLRLAKAIEAISRADYLIAVRFVNPRLALDEVTLALAAMLAG